MRCYIIWILLLTSGIAISQPGFDRVDITFVNGQDTLANALAGGLNAPQLSEIDLNSDGILDLFIFDKVGNVILPFLNSGIVDSTSYLFAPDYIDSFPLLNEWVLLRDFNADGLTDVFALSSIPGAGGMEVHRASRVEGKLQFERLDFPGGPLPIVYVPLSSGYANLLISSIDYPAIDDINGDGDLDIVTFNAGGGVAEYYENQSMENGYGADSLQFELEDDCWGGFFESGFNEIIDLASNAGECALTLIDNQKKSKNGVRHSGSTVLTFDMNGDGDKEVFLGDISFTNISMLENGGSATQAFMTFQEVNFPADDTPVDINIFPASFHLDLDNDGVRDFVAAPNNTNGIEDYEACWYYKNDGSTNAPDFNLKKKNLFIDEMIDLGSGARPAIADVNGDGLLDLVLGNFSTYKPGGERDGRLVLYLNVGSITEPVFLLEDDNWLNFRQYNNGSFNFAPCFGDLDSDGDQDLVVGEEFGKLYFVENIAAAENAPLFDAPVINYQSIDVGQSSVPFIYDLNNDGLNDILIGERSGNVNYFQNSGIVSSPSFEPNVTVAPNIEVLGSIDARQPGFVGGFSSPTVLKIDGITTIYVGNLTGQIEEYRQVSEDLSVDFQLSTQDFGITRSGQNLHTSFGDYNGDGILDMVVGNFRGGIEIFKTDLSTTRITNTNVVKNLSQAGFKIYPNPFSEFIIIENTNTISEAYRARILDITGRIVKQYQLSNRREPIGQSLHAGLYILEVQTTKGSYSQKLIKN